ncbi:hypothetical protein EIN43_13235 [Enterobacter hormaechei]|uniref:Mur ligase N-terminal catalytic domain-containing protein n=1 Tax=Enterobacter hormaechei TaxID=158836 RepID=A0A4Y5ZPN7_9ENTR|nr:hypothetical protein EIN43_13235 [Enterobacter hormaechei]
MPEMRRVRHIHFVGIGGAGMGGIAEVLANEGYQISGSDRRQTLLRSSWRRWGDYLFQSSPGKRERCERGCGVQRYLRG